MSRITADQLKKLCETNSDAQEELRALYDGLWKDVMGLELRSFFDIVLDRDVTASVVENIYLDEDHPDKAICAFASKLLTDIVDVLESTDSMMEYAVEVDNRQRYRNSLLERYEKAPLNLVLLLGDCLRKERLILHQFSRHLDVDICGPPACKRTRVQPQARRDNLHLRQLVSLPADTVKNSKMLSLLNRIRETHSQLLKELTPSGKLKFMKESNEKRLSELSRDIEDTLENLLLLRSQESLSAEETTSMGKELLTRCLVLTSLSDRVIKKNKANYELRLRYLCPKFLSDELFVLQMAVVNEVQMPELKSSIDPSSLENLRSMSGVEYRRTTWSTRSGDGMKLIFKFTSLPRDQYHSSGSVSGASASASRQDDGGVCHEKFALVVFCKLATNDFQQESSGGSFLTFACSLPVVFITHDSQKPAATVTVLHDTLTALPDRVGFETRPQLIPVDAADIFNELAVSVLKMELGLSVAQRKYLIGLAEQLTVDSLTGLTKVRLPQLNRTLCDFVYQCLKYANELYPKLWQAGYVYGFASKEVAKHLLSADAYPIGTFLLRFSETTCQLSVSWKRSEGCIEALEPFTPEELKSDRLERLLNAKASLQYLVTADEKLVKKLDALKDFLTGEKSQRSRVDGYVPRTVLDESPVHQFASLLSESSAPAPGAVSLEELLQDPDSL